MKHKHTYIHVTKNIRSYIYTYTRIYIYIYFKGKNIFHPEVIFLLQTKQEFSWHSNFFCTAKEGFTMYVVFSLPADK